MFSTFNNIYTFIIKSTVIVLGSIITAFSTLIPYLLFNNPLLYIPFAILGVIISIIIGSHLFVILSIPFQLPQKFDPIKNRVSLKSYSNIQEFQKAIADFMITFFNFRGVDIVGGRFHFINCESITIKCDADLNSINEHSFKKNRKRLNSNHQAFHIPIRIGDRDLGYMILITKGYTLPIFYSILEDFENYYLDDQILHFID